jgi:hypothetical protein
MMKITQKYSLKNPDYTRGRKDGIRLGIGRLEAEEKAIQGRLEQAHLEEAAYLRATRSLVRDLLTEFRSWL